jgi:hypothetical protein
MVFQPPSMGFKSLLGMGPTSTIVEQYEFKSESLASDRALVRNPGIRGSRSQVIERVRQGCLSPGGVIQFEPTLAEMRNFLPRIFGGAEVADSGYFAYAITDTLPYFWTSIWRVAGLYTYNSSVIDSATFHSSSGGPLDLSLAIEALTETIVNPGVFQSGLTIDAHAPLVHMDSTLTLNGSPVQVMDIEVHIDNMLKKDRFVNSITRTDLPPMGRVVTLKVTVPYTADTLALYDTGMAGVTADVIWSVGGAGDGAAGTDLHLLLQNVIFPAHKSPTVPGHDEITLTLTGQVYMTGGNNEISAKIDITP